MANTKIQNEKFNEFAITHYENEADITMVEMYPVIQNPGMDDERIIGVYTSRAVALFTIARLMCEDFKIDAEPRGDSFEDYRKDVDNEYPFYEIDRPKMVNVYTPALTFMTKSYKGHLISSLDGDYFEIFTHEGHAISHWTWLQYGTWSHNHALQEKYPYFTHFIQYGDRWQQYDICEIDINLDSDWCIPPEIYDNLLQEAGRDGEMGVADKLFGLESILNNKDGDYMDALVAARKSLESHSMHD